jgi:asparagine synthase (glutamine-hydrolysing)
MAPFVLHLSGPGWTESAPSDGPRCWLKGQTYLDGNPIRVDDLASHLRAAPSSPQSLTVSLAPLNGFYAWVTQADQELRAGVDHIRSRPLFYGQAGGRFYLADEAEWVRQQVGDREMDPIAREEFQLAGYVTGADTLFPHVKQLQAGEFLTATASEGGIIRVETQRYYRFLHTEPARYDATALGAELDRVAVASIQRLIDYAGGRQIVVPLSGGYDSRLIVTLLKRLGYHHVLGFSYGVAGNEEAACSRDVAAALDIPWRFIEYTNAGLADAWSSDQAKDYRAMAANHSSLPHVQDWFAVKKLLDEGHITSDAIVAPGHSGDFVAGSHIPPFVFERKTFFLAELLGRLTNGHLANAPEFRFGITRDGTLERRLLDRIGYPFDGTDISMANLIELWDWQERQAKYIVNSVRVYDHFHLDWWMPLWDIEFVHFWESVPLALRRERKWFKEWIDAQYLAIGGRPLTTYIAAPAKIQRTLVDRVKNQARLFLPRVLADQLRAIKWRLKSGKNSAVHQQHFLAFAGLVPRSQLENYLARGYNIIGIYSDLYIRKEWDTITGW